jgi:hypothetical protein
MMWRLLMLLSAFACLQRLLSYDNAAEVMYGATIEDAGPGDPSRMTQVPSSATSAATAYAGLATSIARLLMQLMDNLEVKSRGYKNESLAALFMMNNVHYVQWSVEGSPAALQLLGGPWLERHKDAVEDWGAKYHDATWMPLVQMLKVMVVCCISCWQPTSPPRQPDMCICTCVYLGHISIYPQVHDS